ncbi:ABC transporter ATP-binding protein [Pseudovibrio japonicus]|uniref:ABC transporter ATP-binding protein n=1 Tax=Pseudovibrio japonicus TaxID=366534 RepID=A0ABQ3ENV4_9HYPH|nr:ABC transporter ATP-binding protein [Pseudovibrio japonicus]GHB43659.1 ABC transporter ATP-binding protein [Pseudovibrio japonicus]
MVAIRIDELTKQFEAFTALAKLSLEVEQEEFVTLLGPSGCGKTTLLKLISGFLDPTEGTIHINGKDVTRTPPEARDTALCFQSYALFPHLTVRENLEFGPRQKRISAHDRKARVDDVAEKLSLHAQMDKLPNQLSGGQQQRVSLGRALVMRPSVILFDEPLSNLDAKLRDQVRIEIRRIQKEYGLTAIYVTHDQNEALAMSDRVVVLNGGRVEQIDTPEALYHAPKTRFVADFIGDANVFSGTVQGEVQPGLWRVETAMGTYDVATSTPPKEKDVDLCWRPESAVLGDAGHTGKVINRAFQGHFTDLMIETKGVSYRVQSRATSAQEGDTVNISIPPEQLILLERTA